MRMIPPLNELRRRLQDVEEQITQIDVRLSTSPESERGALFSHQVALLRKKHWYLGRIRAQQPVEALQVQVHDDIKTGDSVPGSRNK